MINEWGSIENIYRNIEQIEPKRVRNLLLKSEQNAFLSKELVKLKDNLFDSLDVDSFTFKDKNYLYSLIDEFEKYQMKEALKLALDDNDVEMLKGE